MSSFLVTIEHTVEELNSILLALAERPFKEVAELIAKIHASANAQAAAAGMTPASAPVAEADEAPICEAA
jgi:hypothetical protein